MEERTSHLTVVVGASTVAEQLRRSLMQHGVAHAGVASHVRGLRRSIVLGENDLVVVCIALDRQTLGQHGASLRKLLADHRCFPKTIRSVGLLTEVGLTSDAAQVGCDVYVHDSEQAAQVVRLLARRWRSQLARQASKRKTSSRETLASDRESSPRNTWTWGDAKFPIEFVPLVSARQEADDRPLTHRLTRHGQSANRNRGLGKPEGKDKGSSSLQ